MRHSPGPAAKRNMMCCPPRHTHRVASPCAGSLAATMEALKNHSAMFEHLQNLTLSQSYSEAIPSALPADWSFLPNLTTFSCDFCSLTGSIPAGRRPLPACARHP